MTLVQACNVGDICGGTAACAWSITRAFPAWKHVVLFLGDLTEETRQAFAPCLTERTARIDDAVLRRHRPHAVILHNTARAQAGPLTSCPSLLYQHSAGRRAEATLRRACSHWLAGRLAPGTEVLSQPVPIPPGAPGADSRFLDDELTIGRICTPQPHKWPAEVIAFYRALAAAHADVRWEFVGCPFPLQPALRDACGGRAIFFPAGWQARCRYWSWQAMLYSHPTLAESFGRTVAEAMRAGCIPIVDRRGGFIEQIDHGRTGMLCNQIEEFSAAVDAVRDRGRRWEISRAARTAADARSSLRSFATAFEDVLNELAAGGRGQAGQAPACSRSSQS
jgi:hypothetical protein